MSERPRARFPEVDVDRIAPRSESLAAREPRPSSDGYDDGFVPNMVATPTFTAEEAQGRTGDYVLTLGLVGSGKSTFHSFLLRFIEQSGALEYEMRIPRLKDGQEDHQTRSLINQWRASWNRGEFVAPTATTEAAIREIRYRVAPTSGVKAEMDFGMIEVSGELLKQVQGGQTGRQFLPEAVHHLVANAQVNLVILMMVHPDTPNNDILLANFIDYIDQKFPGRRAGLSLGVIIANPDRALEQMVRHTGNENSPYAHYQQLEDDAIIDYMRTMSPGIWARWASWPKKRRMMTPLRLGDIRMDTGPDGEDIPRLINPDYDHITKIFDWLYVSFTGKRRGPTFWQRLLSDI